MYRRTVLLAVGALAFSVAAANAQTKPNQSGGASTYAPGHQGNVGQTSGQTSPGRNSAPGQQMLDDRTSQTAPGNSFDAPGQKKIRERTK
jgi:hypothetical protein